MSDYLGAMGTAIYTVLTGGSALVAELGGSLIYNGYAPDGQSRPYIIFNHQGGGPENNPAGMRNNVWVIRAYADTLAKAAAIDKQIDTLLDGNNFSVTGFTNFWTVRESDIALVETPPDGGRIHVAGGIYRIRVGY